VVEFLLVFDGLDAKKNGAKTKRGDEENADELLFPDLRGTRRPWPWSDCS